MENSSKSFRYEVRVGYTDADQMGFAHHSRFLVFLESARTELLRSTGQSYRQWEERGTLLPVTGAKLDYRSPAYYDDVLAIDVSLVKMTRLRLEFTYIISCPDRSKLIAEATTSHVFMSRTTMKPIRADQSIMESLGPWL